VSRRHDTWFTQRLIEAKAIVGAAQLVDPSVNLKRPLTRKLDGMENECV
jgi:hypothetical protein